MIEGQIFLAENHIVDQNRDRQVISVANGVDLDHIYIFEAISLAGGKHLIRTFDRDVTVLIVPITGMLGVDQIEVDVEQCYANVVKQHDLIDIHNLFENEVSSFILIGISENGIATTSELSCFDSGIRNQLLRLGTSNRILSSIAFFDGRGEINLKNHTESDYFLFAIAGAFEASGRLLHQHDALVLYAPPMLEIEALSNHAVLMVLEVLPSPDQQP